MPKSSGWSRVVVLFCFMFALTAPCLVVVSGTAAAMVAAQEDDPATLPEDRIQDLILPAEKAFSGDVKEIRQRGVLRVLVTYRKGDFFIADGELRGVEVELARAFAAWLGKKGGKKALPVRAIFIPVAFDELLTALEQGKGDIAAAGFTVTEARSARVPFATPYLRGIDEVFAIRKGAPVPTSLDELAGRTVHVVRGSSHEQHLGELNVRLAAQGLAPLNIVTPSADLQPEDLFDLLGTGAIDLMVADSHRARLWRRAMPDVQVLPSLKLKTGQDIAWAVRPDAPGLLHEVNAFFAADGGRAVKKAAGLLERYYADRSWHVEGLNEDALLFARANVLKNGLEDRVSVRRVDVASTRLDEKFDVIAASEVLYLEELHRPLIKFLLRHLARREDAVAMLCTDTRRKMGRFFKQAERDFRIEEQLVGIRTTGDDGEEERRVFTIHRLHHKHP